MPVILLLVDLTELEKASSLFLLSKNYSIWSQRCSVCTSPITALKTSDVSTRMTGAFSWNVSNFVVPFLKYPPEEDCFTLSRLQHWEVSLKRPFSITELHSPIQRTSTTLVVAGVTWHTCGPQPADGVSPELLWEPVGKSHSQWPQLGHQVRGTCMRVKNENY